MARRGANGVRLITRNGHDFTARFPLAAAVGALPANSFLIDGEAIVTNAKGLAVFDLIRRARLKVRSCFIDGEAIVVDERGLSAFDLLRSWHHDHAAVLCAFDLIELDGKDLRSNPLERRKQALAELLHRERDGIALNVHYDCDGTTVFKHACALGCEGIVSKRRGSAYRSGRVGHWLKIKNPAAPAVKREAQEDWGNKRWSHAT
jgi:bifunctional non-homologous end joining protein LigD